MTGTADTAAQQRPSAVFRGEETQRQATPTGYDIYQAAVHDQPHADYVEQAARRFERVQSPPAPVSPPGAGWEVAATPDPRQAYSQQGYPPYQPTGGGYVYSGPEGYPPQPGQGFDIGEAFNWAWNKFSKNAVALIVPALVCGVGWFVVSVVFDLARAAISVAAFTGEPSSGASAAMTVLRVLGYLLTLFVLAPFLHAGYLSGCLDIADGRPVTIGTFFRPRQFGAVAVSLALILPLLVLGTILCIVPGLVVAVGTMFTGAFIVERSLSPVEAIKASIATVRNNMRDAVVSALVQMAVVFIGMLACGFGLAVAAPLTWLILVYTYRRLSGGSVVPAQP